MAWRNFCLLAGVIGIAACDRSRDDGGESAAPAAGRTMRAPRVDGPAGRLGMRRELEAAMREEAGEERDAALAEVVWNALETDPDLAREALDHLTEDGAERVRLIGHFAMTRAEADPEAALAWAARLDSEVEMAAAFGKIALVMADEDPVRAAHVLSESGIAGREFDLVVVQALQRWASRAPRDAADWVLLFPPGRARDAGLATVVSEWVSKDGPAAVAWLGEIKAPEVREAATKVVAAEWSGLDLEMRAEWLRAADAETEEGIREFGGTGAAGGN